MFLFNIKIKYTALISFFICGLMSDLEPNVALAWPMYVLQIQEGEVKFRPKCCLTEAKGKFKENHFRKKSLSLFIDLKGRN